MASPTLLAILLLGCLVARTLGDLSLTSADHDLLVKLHNDARAAENAKVMNQVSWDEGLASEAQSWADGCVFKHQHGKSWGENLSAVGTGGSSISDLSASLSRMFGLWMKEKQYNEQGTFEECCSQTSYKCCHYTQVIWSDSVKVGCGLASCPVMSASWGNMNDMLYLACYYSPPGNKPAVMYTFDWRPYMPIEE